MKILFIPLEMSDPLTNERSPSMIRILSHKHTLIGLKRVRYFNTRNQAIRPIRAFFYGLRVFWFGLRHSKEVDLIFCENVVAYALIGICISLISHKPCIWDSHGHGLTRCRELEQSKLVTFFTLIAEKIALVFVKGIIIVSEVDKEEYVKQGCKPNKIVVIPTCADFSLIDKVANDRRGVRRKLKLEEDMKYLLFIGKREYPPNMEAAKWINERLAPAISQKFDAVRILMSGDEDLSANIHDKVRFTGFVPNIYELVIASDICICPIWRGVGIITKVIDTLACARPTIVSEFVTIGIPRLVDGKNVIIARTKQEFIQKVEYLLEAPAPDIGTLGRKTIEEYYNWDKWEEKLNDFLEKSVHAHVF